MTVTTSKQRNGSLLLGATNFACQQRSVQIDPPEQEDDQPEEVLCGDPLDPEEEKPWKLSIEAVQDFEDPDGFVNYTWDHHGDVVPFTWKPQGATGPTYSGSVKVNAVTVGGLMNRRLTSEGEWSITTGKPTRTPAPAGT